MRIELEDGKYTYLYHPDGRQEALRYGEPWRDLIGDKFIAALATSHEDLRAKLAEAKAEIQEQARLNGMGAEREAKLMVQLAEVTRELKVLSDFCEGAEDRSLLHKGGLKCLVDAVQKQSDNYARALAAGSKRIAEIHQIEQQLAEVTRERDHWKNNHATEVRRARILKERPDLPIERVNAYEQWGKDIERLSELQEENARLREESRNRPFVAAPSGVPDFEPDAKRLALELECLLLECKDMAAVSKWWDSAHEALEQHRAMLSAAPAAPDHISQPVKMVEPFGYLKAEPFGWTDCSEEDEGAIPLYDKKTVDELIHAAIYAYMEKN